MGPDAAICLRPIQAAPPEQLLSDDHSAVRFLDVPELCAQPGIRGVGRQVVARCDMVNDLLVVDRDVGSR